LLTNENKNLKITVAFFLNFNRKKAKRSSALKASNIKAKLRDFLFKYYLQT
jgi:hypothetical protein